MKLPVLWKEEEDEWGSVDDRLKICRLSVSVCVRVWKRRERIAGGFVLKEGFILHPPSSSSVVFTGPTALSSKSPSLNHERNKDMHAIKNHQNRERETKRRK